jgi:hypothetical protein
VLREGVACIMDDVSIYTYLAVMPEMPADEYVVTRVTAFPEI